MKLFQTVLENFAAIGIIRSHDNDYHYYPYNRQHLKIQAISILSLISFYVFAFHVADSPEEYMDAFYMTTLVTAVFISYTISICKTNNLFNYIDSCENIFNELSEDPVQKKNLEKTNQLVELLSKISFIMAKLSFIAFMLPKAGACFYVYLTTDSGNDAFELPFPQWFPFNYKSPFGYSIAVILEFVTALLPLQYLACLLSVVLGGYLFARSIVKFMKTDLKSINKMARAKKSESDIFKKLSAFILSHTKAKQIIDEFSNTYNITMTVMFLSCTLTISVAMLMIQIEISHTEIHFLMLWKLIFYWVASVNCVFISCEFSQRLCNLFSKINDVFDRFDWYLYPIGIQKMLPIILPNVQKPVSIKCFGNISGSRDQFKKVINAAYKYFMVLRK